MKSLIIFLLFMAAIHLPGMVIAQERVPIKSADGEVPYVRPVPVPVKQGGNVVTPPANPPQTNGTPVSLLQLPKPKTNTDAPVKTPATTSTLTIEQLFKPFTAIQPPVIEQENSNQPKPVKP